MHDAIKHTFLGLLRSTGTVTTNYSSNMVTFVPPAVCTAFSLSTTFSQKLTVRLQTLNLSLFAINEQSQISLHVTLKEKVVLALLFNLDCGSSTVSQLLCTPPLSPPPK